ncbi:MAG: glycosyltransferase [Chitinophagales bacterium]|nr:glycosyltransferase [Chitinophagales bacterium]
MKQILFLTTQLPFPPISGGIIKTYKLIEYFYTKYDITLACFLKSEEEVNELPKFQKLFPNIKIIAFPFSVDRNIKTFIKSNLQKISMNEYRNRSTQMHELLQPIWNTIDTVFVDHLEMYQYIPNEFKGKKILHQHNAEFVMWYRFALLEKNYFKRFALRNQAYQVQQLEKKYCNDADVILAAPNDQHILEQIGIPKNKFRLTYHLGDDTYIDNNDLVYNRNHKAIMYVGTLSWEANVNGLLWFINHIWQQIIEKEPNTKFYIIGKNPDERLKQAAQQFPNIVFTGFVADLESYFQQCSVAIAPLLFGSGIKVKVISYMYRGIPCVTTNIGVEGLAVTDEQEIMIKDNADDFAIAVLALMNNEVLWNKLSQLSRNFAKTNLSWNAVLQIAAQTIDEDIL